jgi:uncharacterized protein
MQSVEDGVVQIDVEYRVRTTNARHNFVFPFYRTGGEAGANK